MTGKEAARKAAFARRKLADPALAPAANRHLERAVRAAEGRVVSGYWPIRTEIDPRPAMTALVDDRDLCLPVISGPDRPLVFRRWRPGAPLVEAGFGVMIPEDGETLEPDVLIVPLAAFDARGYRLGYGGGFYDRTLAALRAKGRVSAIGFAYAVQEADEVPTEPTDERLDAVVTEVGARRFSGV